MVQELSPQQHRVLQNHYPQLHHQAQKSLCRQIAAVFVRGRNVPKIYVFEQFGQTCCTIFQVGGEPGQPLIHPRPHCFLKLLRRLGPRSRKEVVTGFMGGETSHPTDELSRNLAEVAIQSSRHWKVGGASFSHQRKR